ncbi:hypothetical protein F4553_005263 [Allocatelliglobosispora scoriae]|uniref:Uncharacterized protein n=1 Tax=Allocatelliglobosispora scoriae TaxID=643052 RepID=A0A841BUK7_9ACTN|nr:CATRA conflict system CASPASE/TPR repeat-associated protein [Allocatelliglobosispora scoriae]MBB5871884.1 hypothetical protein [Allocatelliglobosispora scoriae]
MSLVQPTLVVYLFAAVTGEDPARATASYQQLRQAWHTIADRLHLDTAASTRLPADPREKAPTTTGTALQAGREGPGRLRQMWWNQFHDVAVISLAISADGISEERGWHALHSEWADVAADLVLPTLLGSTQVYTARTATNEPLIVSPTDGAPDKPATTAQLGPYLPGIPASGWADSATLVRTGGFVIYELSPRAGLQPDRQLVVLAPHDRDDELGSWVWQLSLGRLPVYLLNSAKLRHQARIIEQQRAEITQRRLSTYQQLNTIQALMYASPTPDIDQLVNAEVTITKMQAQSEGLVDTQARIATFQRTIGIAASNITTLTDPVLDPTRRSLVDDDQALAQGISAALDDDHAFLAAVTTRAQHVATAAHTLIAQHRVQTERTAQHRANQYNLLQTGILTAVVTALAAVQAFGYKISTVPPPAQPAVIALLAAITLLLYAIPLHHGEKAMTERDFHFAPRHWPTRLLRTAGALTGAALGWTIASLLQTSAGRAHLTTTLAVAGLILATAATTLATRQPRSKTARADPAAGHGGAAALTD